MDMFKRESCKRMGPGGIKCICCGPAPGKERKASRRAAKRRLRQLTKKEVKLEIE